VTSDSLRTRAARGTLVNAGFTVGIQSIGLLKGLIVAGLLTASEYGVWGLLVVTVAAVTLLKEVGIQDKYVQQEEPDQEAAFQRAFSVDALANAVAFAAVLALLPIFALLYGERWEIVAPGLVLALALPAQTLKTPAWIFYRRMRYGRQRALEAVDPLASFVVTVALAAAGLGYWSLVIGYTAGVWVAGLAAVAASPYRPALRLDRATLREYASFSWPLIVATGSGVLIPQLAMIVGSRAIGLAGVGAIALAALVVNYTDRVDQIVTSTLYPAICRVKDRTDLLYEAFVKSNRLALMWGVPFGAGVALFADDLVAYGIGEEWRDAVPLLQVFGLIAALNHVGFNWNAFYSARGDTRPMAVIGPIGLGAFVLVTIPLTIAWELDGFAAGMAIVTVVTMLVRNHFIRRLFPDFRMAAYLARAAAPTVPAAAVVLAARALVADRSLGIAIAELALYVAVTVAATWMLERPLLREALDYLRGRGTARLVPA
jgi:O-antigen/teichoic acid export membrane protein